MDQFGTKGTALCLAIPCQHHSETTVMVAVVATAVKVLQK